MEFLSYQRDWITDESRMRLLVKSRRIGGTYAQSYDSFRTLMRIKNHDIVIITRDMFTALEYVRYVGSWAKLWNSTHIPSQQIPKKCIKSWSITIPHKEGDSRLIAVSSNPDAAAGKGGDLVIDEMALHKQQQLLVTVAKPIVTAGGRLTVISTHRSKNSLFNQYVIDAETNEQSPWSLHKITIQDAVNMGFVENIVNPTRLRCGEEPMTREDFIWDLRHNIINDEGIWEQEYMCIPSEQQYTLIPWSLVENAARETPSSEYMRDGRPRGPCYLGWDIAESEHGDYSVMFVITRVKDVLYVLHHEYMKGIDLPDQRDKLKRLVAKYSVRKIWLDAGGLGRDSVKILQRQYGKKMVTGWQPTMQSKEEVCSKMLSIFQEGMIVIPRDDKVMTDINAVEKIYTSAGNVTYHAPYVNGSHADGFWSLGLAVMAAGWTAISAIEIVGPSDRDKLGNKESWKDPKEWAEEMDMRKSDPMDMI